MTNEVGRALRTKRGEKTKRAWDKQRSRTESKGSFHGGQEASRDLGVGISWRCLATKGRRRAPWRNPAEALSLLPWGKKAAAAAVGSLGTCRS